MRSSSVVEQETVNFEVGGSTPPSADMEVYDYKSIPISDEEAEAFLHDLEHLTRRHGIMIRGCGCCGSPYLLRKKDLPHEGHYDVVRADELYLEELEWIIDAPPK